MLGTVSAYELQPAWPHVAVPVQLQSQCMGTASHGSFLIRLNPLFFFFFLPVLTLMCLHRPKTQSFQTILPLKQMLSDFLFSHVLVLVWIVSFLSGPTTIKRKKACLSKDIDKKVYFSLTSEDLHYPEKAQKSWMSQEGLGRDVRNSTQFYILLLFLAFIYIP